MKVEGKRVMEGCRLDLGVLDLDKGGPEFLGLAGSAWKESFTTYILSSSTDAKIGISG